MTRVGVRRVVSGGQTGADRGGLDAALELGLAVGGFCPRGRRAEDGVIPDRYPLVELTSPAYPPRTRKNVALADATVVFSFGTPDRGTALTLELARAAGKPVLWLDLGATEIDDAAARLRAWLATEDPSILNVAGSRESNAPGLGEKVRRVVLGALRAERR
jgi:hypothetical protein